MRSRLHAQRVSSREQSKQEHGQGEWKGTRTQTLWSLEAERGTWADTDSFTRQYIACRCRGWRVLKNACGVTVFNSVRECIWVECAASRSWRSSSSKSTGHNYGRDRQRQDTTGADWLKFYHGSTRLETRPGTMHTCIVCYISFFFVSLKFNLCLYLCWFVVSRKHCSFAKSTTKVVLQNRTKKFSR
jgi:hypothetical protein